MIAYESYLQGEIPVVIDFFAEWCQPCKLMTPILQELREVTGERAKVISIDIEKEQALARLFDVQAVPTLLILHNKQVVWRKNGIATLREILENLQMIIA
jgi:thioredoxin 1